MLFHAGQSQYIGNYAQCIPAVDEVSLLEPKTWTSTEDFLSNIGYKWSSSSFKDRLAIVDPAGSTTTGAVRVTYGPGVGPGTSGIAIYGFPSNYLYPGLQRMTFQFDGFFPSGFKFVKEGKMHGIWGKRGVTAGQEFDCGGGVNATANQCFSVRGMWRSAVGAGALYVYGPPNQIYCGDYAQTICDPAWGDIVGKNFNFPVNAWFTTLISVDLTNQVIQIYVNNQLLISYKGVNFNGIKEFGGIKFETFFGGGSSDFASPTTQYAYFRNFKVRGTKAIPAYGTCGGGGTKPTVWSCTGCTPLC